MAGSSEITFTANEFIEKVKINDYVTLLYTEAINIEDIENYKPKGAFCYGPIIGINSMLSGYTTKALEFTVYSRYQGGTFIYTTEITDEGACTIKIDEFITKNEIGSISNSSLNEILV